jgi:hypothetical protein
MDIYAELNLYITTFHPKIQLGNDSLKCIKLSRTATVESFSKDLIFLIRPKVKTQEPSPPVPEAPASPVTLPKPPSGIFKRSIKELLPVQSSIEQLKIANSKKYKQTLIKLSAKNEVPQKRPPAMVCPVCNWEFPSYYTENDVQKHVNLCIDVKKNQDDVEKLEKKFKKKENESDLDDDEEILRIQEELDRKCPHCGLKIGKRSDEFQKRHVQECFNERNEPYAANKTIYQELGIIPKKDVDSSTKKYLFKRMNS